MIGNIESEWREIAVIDYIIQAKSRTRVIWLGGIISSFRIVEGVFRVTRTKARELISTKCERWQSFVANSCYSLHVIPERKDWEDVDSKKQSFAEWFNSQKAKQNGYSDLDSKKFLDNIIITTFDTIKNKRLIVDGMHRSYALLKACYDKVDIPEVKIFECYGSKIEVIFPCDIHQL